MSGARLPAVVRVVAVDDPLKGRVVRARRVYRQWERLWLVLGLPDGGVVLVEVADTDVPEDRASDGATCA